MAKFAVQPPALRELAGLLGRGAEDTQVKCVLGAERDPVRPATLQILAGNSLASFLAQCTTDRPQSGCETRTPTSIEGFPVVENNHDIFQLMVAVTDEKTLLVNDLPGAPCDRMATIATLSLTKLRAGA